MPRKTTHTLLIHQAFMHNRLTYAVYEIKMISNGEIQSKYRKKMFIISFYEKLIIIIKRLYKW